MQPVASKTEGRREKLRGIRRVVAEHMARAHREVPAVTWVEECDFENVPMDRLVAVVVKASAGALAEFPELNARLEGDEIVYLDRYDIGVAVQTEHGLVVPVVRGVDSRTVDEIHEDLERLAAGRASREPRAGGAPRLDVHGDECGQARRPLSDADRQPPRGRDSQHRTNRAASCRARWRRRRPKDRRHRRQLRPSSRGRSSGGRVRAFRDRAPGTRPGELSARRVAARFVSRRPRSSPWRGSGRAALRRRSSRYGRSRR